LSSSMPFTQISCALAFIVKSNSRIIFQNLVKNWTEIKTSLCSMILLLKWYSCWWRTRACWVNAIIIGGWCAISCYSKGSSTWCRKIMRSTRNAKCKSATTWIISTNRIGDGISKLGSMKLKQFPLKEKQ